MLSMVSISWGRNVCLISEVLHYPFSGLIRFAAISLYPIVVLGVITLPDDDEGSHLAFHISILLPSPTTH